MSLIDQTLGIELYSVANPVLLGVESNNNPLIDYSRETCTIDGWIKMHASLEETVKFSEKETFFDHDGVLRYVDTWKIVDLAAVAHDLPRCEGCVEFPVFDPRDPRKVKFIADFQRLWKHFELDEDDDLAQHAPLLRLFIEFFFHHRTSYLVTFLFLYNIAVLIVVGIYAGYTSSTSIAFDVLCIVVYLPLRRLYKGSFWSVKSTSRATDCGGKQRRGTVRLQPGSSSQYSLHWFSSLTKMCKMSFYEMWRLCFPANPRAAQQHRPPETLSYYDLLNVALKFLTRHSHLSTAVINFNRPSYRISLLLILFALPIYLIGYAFGFQAYDALSSCDNNWGGSSGCRFSYYYMLATLGFTTSVLLNYFFAASVLLSLVGLAYGCEIANRMTDSWIKRFCSLRRVEHGGKCSALRHAEEESGDCDDARREGSRDTGVLLPYISRDAFEHYLFLHEFMKQASRVWSPALLGIFAILVYVVALYAVILFFYASIVTSHTLIALILYGAVRFLVLLVYPVVSLSHANSYVYSLQRCFRAATPEDFSILGGKELWIAFLNDCPAVWSFYGLWITWEKLFGMLWGMFIGVLALVGSVITNLF